MTRPGGTFGIPAVLAAATTAALIAGLLGDGLVDVVAWAGLAAPLIATTLCTLRPERPRKTDRG